MNNYYLIELHGQGDSSYKLVTEEVYNKIVSDVRNHNDLALSLEDDEIIKHFWSAKELTDYVQSNDIRIIKSYEGYIY